MPSTSAPNPKDTLRMLRTVWAGLLGGQVMFIAAIVWLHGGGAFKASPALAQVFFQSALWGLVVFAPLAYLLRLQVYKRHWRGDAVQPRGYFLGNLILFVVFETVSLLGLIALLLAGELRTAATMPPLLALTLIVINYPTGKPMEPRGPELLYR